MKVMKYETKYRGIYEKQPGSGIWYVRYVDAGGRYRREKAGSKSAAILLYRKRKTEALEGRKLPEKLRRRSVRFSELAEDARQYSQANNLGRQMDGYRIDRFLKAFGDRSSDIPIDRYSNEG